MIDKQCIHIDVCSYAGFAVQDCEKCKFRRYLSEDLKGVFATISNQDIHGLVGIWIKHDCAEYEGDNLIDNYECPYCGKLFKQTSDICPNCNKHLIVVHQIKSE